MPPLVVGFAPNSLLQVAPMYKSALRSSPDHRRWEEAKRKFLLERRRKEEEEEEGERRRKEVATIQIEEITERLPITAIEPERNVIADDEEEEEEENLVLDFPHFPARTRAEKKT